MNGRIFLAVLLIALGATGARAQLYLANPNSGVVSEFDPTTGELNHKFSITIGKPRGVCYADGFLYVTDYNAGTVGKYNATTGAAVNAQLVSGLLWPLAVTVSGHDLYVSGFVQGGLGMAPKIVGKYDSVTGGEINSRFITTSDLTTALVATPDRLYVIAGDAVQTYDSKTGHQLNPYFTGRPWSEGFGIAVQGDYLWLSSGLPAPGGAVGKYMADTGYPASGVTGLLIPRLDCPGALAISGDDLYIASYQSGTVGKYNAYSGDPINPKFITDLGQDIGSIAVVPAPLSEGISASAAEFDLKNGFVNSLFFLFVHPLYLSLIAVGLLIVFAGIVALFVMKRKSAQEARDSVTENQVALAFPEGPEMVSLSSFLWPPTSGVVLQSDSDQFEWVSLHKGDVIVAFDGYRINNEVQFQCQRTRSTKARMDLIFWRTDHYMQITITAPGRNFPMGIAAFRP
jgi:hypothetical protein